MAYKNGVDDPRASPTPKIMDLIKQEGAGVSYNDPHIPRAPGSGITLISTWQRRRSTSAPHKNLT
jgi:UDP-N-acetyl-D-mannosaminuronate dehydrogenase